MAVVASIPTLATYLQSGYWAYSNYDGTQPRHWGSTSISVNVNALTAAEQILVGGALSMWASVAPLTFTYTGGAANITFNHNGAGLVANTTDTTAVVGQLYQAETVDISTGWYNNDGGYSDGLTGTYSYVFQTYIHEIGHALGLGHEGPYNNSATYGTDNIYTNDTWQYSIMSYFDQSKYNGGIKDYVISPEMADIYAIQQIYGANNSTRTGNTTYGFNSSAGPIFDFASYTGQGTPAFTIYDSGGNDTLDASGYSQDQTINLNYGSWSSIGGYINNIGIYITTSIENAVGGTGNDLIIPNGALVSTLAGGGGDDTFQGTTYELTEDTITDMNVGDRINFTNGVLDSINPTLNGTTLTYAGGYTITLSNNPIGHFAVGDNPLSGVDLRLMQSTPMSDFSDDGRSDILWRSSGGALADWSMAGSAITSSQLLSAAPGASWSIAEIADFNGDGHSDILWRDTSGALVDWSMNGGTIASSQVLGAAPDASWSIAGTGDFDGDHHADLLWRNTDGRLAEWSMNGGTIASSHFVGASPDASWSVAGIGDFNHDGTSDILWRNANGTLAEWSMSGGAIGSSQLVNAAPGASWSVAGVGDFFGTGHSDVLWRNTDGTLVEWLMDGAQVAFSVTINAAPDSSWSIVEMGDFNGDGRSDILWRQSTTGQLAEWQMFGVNILTSQLLSAAPDGSWQTQAKPTDSVV